MRDFGRGGGRRFNDRGGRGGFSRGGFSRGGDREMFKTTCSNCGKDCEVPFRPTSGKPVYCSDCFEKIGNTRSDTPRFSRPERSEKPQGNNNAQFEALNAKLDKIISLLQPKIVEVSMPDIVVEEVKKEKAPKVKKVTSKKK